MKHPTSERGQSAPVLIPRASLSRDRCMANCVSRLIDTDAPSTSGNLGRQSRSSGKGFLLFLLAILVLLFLSNCNVASAGVNTWTSNGPEGGPPSCTLYVPASHSLFSLQWPVVTAARLSPPEAMP